MIEVDHNSESLERLPIFAALGIVEVWRLAVSGLEFLHLGDDQTYGRSERSLCFPRILAEEIARFLELARADEEIAWIRGFEAWARDRGDS